MLTNDTYSGSSAQETPFTLADCFYTGRHCQVIILLLVSSSGALECVNFIVETTIDSSRTFALSVKFDHLRFQPLNFNKLIIQWEYIYVKIEYLLFMNMYIIFDYKILHHSTYLNVIQNSCKFQFYTYKMCHCSNNISCRYILTCRTY